MRRHRGGMVGLSLTVLALCVTIHFELAGHRGMARADPEPRGAVSSHIEAAAGAASTDQRNRWFNEVVARPLFSPDRRPAGNQDHGGGGLPRLTAIILDGRRRIAMFEAQAGGRATVVEIGSSIGGYDVRDITEGGLTVAGPEGTVVIRPAFDGAPRAAETGVAAPVAQSDAEPRVHRAALPAHPAFFNVTAR